MSKAIGTLAFIILLVFGLFWAWVWQDNWQTKWQTITTNSSMISSVTGIGGNGNGSINLNGEISKHLLNSSSFESQARVLYSKGDKNDAFEKLGLSIGNIESIQSKYPKYESKEINSRLKYLKGLEASWRKGKSSNANSGDDDDKPNKPRLFAFNSTGPETSGEATTTTNRNHSILDDSKRSIASMAGTNPDTVSLKSKTPSVQPPPPISSIPKPQQPDQGGNQSQTTSAILGSNYTREQFNEADFAVELKEPSIMWWHAVQLKWMGENFESEGNYSDAKRAYHVSKQWYQKIKEFYPEFQPRFTDEGIDLLDQKLESIVK